MKPIKTNPYESAQEQRFADWCQKQKLAGKLEDWHYGLFTFHIGGNYTPDFFLVFPDRFSIVEVKGGTRTKKLRKSKPFTREDDILKVKMLKKQHPYFEVLLAWESSKDNWQFREIK